MVWVTRSSNSNAQMQIGSDYLTSWDYYLELNFSGGQTNSNGAARWNNTAPTSTVVSVGAAACNLSGETMYMYSWRSVPGYSSIGSYQGNGNSDGPFVYCGFRPNFVLLKCTNSTGDWILYDGVRPYTYNPQTYPLVPNETYGEASKWNGYDFDILSNGFKLRTTQGDTNQSGVIYVYAAFAEHPLGGGNVAPSPAR
jgi:hypothetical protein